jgi:hypothetical protein
MDGGVDGVAGTETMGFSEGFAEDHLVPATAFESRTRSAGKGG